MSSHSSRRPCKDLTKGKLNILFHRKVSASQSMASRSFFIERFWKALRELIKRVKDGASLKEMIFVSHRT